ncbi:MAG: hypothetical protein R3E35_09820 [Rhodocyclaceae bacterium]
MRFQIVGIEHHVKIRAIIGLQPSDIKNYRTDVDQFAQASFGLAADEGMLPEEGEAFREDARSGGSGVRILLEQEVGQALDIALCAGGEEKAGQDAATACGVSACSRTCLRSWRGCS